MPGETPYCSPIDPFDESKGYECGAASLLADNARLQARVKDSIAVIDVAAAGAVRLKRERDDYKALAERRGSILKAAYDLINYREHAFYEPEVPLDTYLYQLHNWLDWALPAIAVTPTKGKERRR